VLALEVGTVEVNRPGSGTRQMWLTERRIGSVGQRATAQRGAVGFTIRSPRDNRRGRRTWLVLISDLEVKQKIVPVIGEGQWTPLEVAIWLSALIITIILCVLAVLDAVGSWAVVVPGAMGVIMALWRFRVEDKRKKRISEE